MYLGLKKQTFLSVCYGTKVQGQYYYHNSSMIHVLLGNGTREEACVTLSLRHCSEWKSCGRAVMVHIYQNLVLVNTTAF
jgi:hypothetical protein